MLFVPVCDMVGFSKSTSGSGVCVRELKAWLPAHIIHTEKKFGEEKCISQNISKLTHKIAALPLKISFLGLL